MMFPKKHQEKKVFSILDDFKGDIEKVELHYLIRDFDQANFEQRKAFIYHWWKNLIERKA